MPTNGFNMSENEVLALVKEVSATLQGIAADPTRLAKGENSSSPEASASGSPMPEGSAGGPPSAPPSAPPGAPAGDPSAPPPGDPSAPPPGDPSAGGEAGGGAGPSFEELVTLYSQLPPADFEAHAAALQAAAQARGGAGGQDPSAGGGAPPSAGGMPPSAPPSAPPGAPAGDPTFKSEDARALKAALGTIESMKKSLDEQSTAIKALGAVVTMPRRQAVTGVTFIPMQKTEAPAGKKKFADMKKSEVFDAVKTMSAGADLKANERQLINDYVLGKAPMSDLAPLFDKVK